MKAQKLMAWTDVPTATIHIRDTFEIQDLVKKSSLIPFRADVAWVSIQLF